MSAAIRYNGRHNDSLTPYRESSNTGLRSRIQVSSQDRSRLGEQNASQPSSNTNQQNTSQPSSNTNQQSYGISKGHIWDFTRVMSPEQNADVDNWKIAVKIITAITCALVPILLSLSLVCNKLSFLILTNGMHKASNELHYQKVSRVKAANAVILCLCAPHAIGAVVAFVKLLFGGLSWPGKRIFLLMMVIDTTQTCSLCLLVFKVFPQLDMIRALLLMSCTCLLPALVKTFFMGPPAAVSVWPFGCKLSVHRVLWMILNGLAFLCQLAILVSFAFLDDFWFSELDGPFSDNQSIFTVKSYGEKRLLWWTVIPLIFVSIRWWENFINHEEKSEKTGVNIRSRLVKLKEDLHNCRQKFSMFSELFSIVVIWGLALVLVDDFKFSMYTGKHATFVNLAPLITQIVSGLLCYILSVVACTLCIQVVGFTLPLLLATITSGVIVILHCMDHISYLDQFIWICPEGFEEVFTFGSLSSDAFSTSSYIQFALLVVGWMASFVTCGHAWWPRQNVLESVEKLFITPEYYGTFMETSLLLNRRTRDKEIRYDSSTGYNCVPHKDVESAAHASPADHTDVVESVVHACATLWHETAEEMTQLLKSIFRLDKDQNEVKAYKLEVHILFDDAWTYTKNTTETPTSQPSTSSSENLETSDENRSSTTRTVNKYVQDFMECFKVAESAVLQRPKRDAYNYDGTKTIFRETPYGGRYEIHLKNNTKMYVHLKDKKQIRHKKRWSQVMYMFYLLNYNCISPLKEEIKGKLKSYTNIMPLDKLRQEDRATYEKINNTYLLALDGDVDFRPESVSLLLQLMQRDSNIGAACGRIHPIGSGPIVWYQIFEYALAHWLQKAAEHVFGCVLCSPGCFSLFRGSALLNDNVLKTYTKSAKSPVERIQYDQGEDRWLCTLLLQAGFRIEYSAAADALTFCPSTFKEFFNQRRRWVPSTMANIIDLLRSFEKTVEVNANISKPFMFYQIFLFFTSLIAPGTLLLSIAGTLRVILATSFVTSYVLAVQPAVFFVIVCMTISPKKQIEVAFVLSAVYSVIVTVTIIGTFVTFTMGSGLNPNVVFLGTLVSYFIITAMMHLQEFWCLLPAPLFFLFVPSGYLFLTIYSICNMHVLDWGTRDDTNEQAANSNDEQQGLGQSLRYVIKWFYDLVKSVTKVNCNRCGVEIATQPGNRSQNAETKKDKDLTHHDPNNSKGKCHIAADFKADTIDPRERAFWEECIGSYLKPTNIEDNKKEKKKNEELLLNLRTICVMGFSLVNFIWIVIIFLLQFLGENDVVKEKIYVPVGEEKFEPFGLIFLVFFAVLISIQFVAAIIHRGGTLMHLIAASQLWLSFTKSMVTERKTSDHQNGNSASPNGNSLSPNGNSLSPTEDC